MARAMANWFDKKQKGQICTSEDAGLVDIVQGRFQRHSQVFGNKPLSWLRRGRQ